MGKMVNLVSSMNGTSASLSLGKAVEGLLVRQTDPEHMDQVSFAYMTPQDKFNVGAVFYLCLYLSAPWFSVFLQRYWTVITSSVAFYPLSVLQIVDDAEILRQFSRSVSVSKQAFTKALSLNISTPFAAVLRFLNMSQVCLKKHSFLSLFNELLKCSWHQTVVTHMNAFIERCHW